MADYTKYKRGSEWRKWDLHIHTPETKKNDRFEGSTPKEKWEKYIEAINNSSEEISVVGITDYFCIENYFKFKELTNDGTITKKFDLILPNIEIRVLPVTGSATPINLHCIFNSKIDSDIENRFLAKLKFSYAGSDYSAKKEELIRLGKTLPGNSSLDNIAALKAGIGQYVVTIECLRTIFEKDERLRENTIIVVSNKSTDGASGIRNHEDFFINTNSSQLDATRWSLYQFSDAIFSSNPNDILYFVALGPDNKETVIEKCGTLMPCYHGCDAHENDKIFKPDDNRFCWIKADPTFEGLKQTLYEPEDRVKVQSLKPDIKNERFVISELQFLDNGKLFGNQKILLNENLNAIIGGKSSGKSLLLYSTAKSIDPEQVDKTSKRLGFEGYKFGEEFNFEVIWKNGEKDILNSSLNKNNKITYIPQLYINYLVEKNNKEDLNNLIENILIQDFSFKQFFDQKNNLIENATSELEKLLTNYLQIRNKALDTQQKSKDLGKSDAISKSIESLQAAILKGQQSSNLSKDEFDNYNKLIASKSQIDKELKDLGDKEIILDKILLETNNSKTSLLGKQEAGTIPLKGRIDRVLDELTIVPQDILSIVKKIETDFSILISNLEEKIEKLDLLSKKREQNQLLGTLETELQPYTIKIAGQQELQKLTIQLENEKQKLQLALNLEKQLSTLLSDYKNVRDKTVEVLKSRYSHYLDLKNQINGTKKEIGSGITMECSLILKQDEFPFFDQVNKAAIPGANKFYEMFSNGLVNYERIMDLYSNQLRVVENKLVLDKDNLITIPLKQKVDLDEVLRGLLVDAFKLDYTVTYKGDDLLSMSPGKKGTVLLILFLQINSSEYPILIDQPEDNLDNRTIYDLLCKMIKAKKKERQIIIVSHNANLVVATDTENIIVANQEGQDSFSAANRYRFEYVNGSLEHTFPKNDKIKELLLQQGIKEHATDILEGGDEAFKQRERKYAIK